ncbi:hypothetical protein K0U27_03830 [archaeon]|nr:hypothetical protein [archaeon]
MNCILILAVVCAVIIAIIAVVILFVVMPLSQPHNPETIDWLNQAECDELKEWIDSKKGTLEKYQSTAQGIYDFKNCT